MKRLFLILLFFSLPAWAALDPAVVKQLAADDSDAKIAAIQQLGAAGDRDALKLLNALGDDALFTAPDGRVFLMTEDKAFDAASGDEIKPVPDQYESITINNRIRAELSNVVAGLRLRSPDRAVRLAAAQELQRNTDIVLVPTLERALKVETDAEINKLLQFALAQAELTSSDAAVRLAAVNALAKDARPRTRGLVAAACRSCE